MNFFMIELAQKERNLFGISSPYVIPIMEGRQASLIFDTERIVTPSMTTANSDSRHSMKVAGNSGGISV